ncbi:CsbD family protein [Clostridium bowmanii]|uniref:CsbD family protein n=1 Tax=Clostridium bowmanii TaxID=132925 RepID=UPI001C0AECF4|nr:CsbD family protein [Clostridium bowmanii]MBU3189608.1 CsbD family protein [Clostridium bowmanii]MCA1073548.1 CsbD family protein [Clostridium bowmanii]
MPNLNNKVENAKDKVVGKTKETVGKVTDSQEMELKGKLQYQKGNSKEKIDKTEDKIEEKLNDTLNEK